MKISKIFLSFCILIALVFTTITLLVIPLWSDIRVFLGINLPVMLIASIFGAACLIAAVYRWIKPSVKQAWPHYLALSITSLVMVVLLYILLTELGTERILIWRNAGHYLPIAGFCAAAAMLLIFPPRKISLRAVLAGAFVIAGLVWVNLPLTVRIVSQPIALINSGGVSLVWGTNMPAISQVEFGPSPSLGSHGSSQSGGLLAISDGIQRVSIPWDLSADLHVRANSEGVRSVFPTSALRAGEAYSELTTIPFPEADEQISFVAFSDVHEQTDLVSELGAKIDWQGVDYAIYVGDLLNNASDPQQVIDSIFDLPSGEANLPRVFVRGNHETRGPDARQLSEWLLPPDGKWYFTFSSGDVFFIILDSGEDKPDDHAEYAGLVDFTTYHQQQAEWLAGIFDSQEYQQAAFRIVLVHQPPFIEVTEAFFPVVTLLEAQDQIDLVISGHIHESGIWIGEDTGLPFPVVTCGGSNPDDMAAVKVDVDQDGLKVEIIGLEGNVLAQAIWP